MDQKHFTLLLGILSLSVAISSDAKTSVDWKKVLVSDLNPDDRILWNQYHKGHDPGSVQLKSRCYANRMIFARSSIAKINGTMFQRLKLLDTRGKVIYLKKIKVSSPFIIWLSPPGKYEDVSSLMKYYIREPSVVFEKPESVSYQVFCANGRWRSIKTTM